MQTQELEDIPVHVPQDIMGRTARLMRMSVNQALARMEVIVRYSKKNSVVAWLFKVNPFYTTYLMHCKDQVNGYKCHCTAGWTGTNCDVNINDCNPDPCAHGSCTVSKSILLWSQSILLITHA